ncbi:hypothetical protein Ahy_B10g101668 isoform A [Arachis hypogaea]|uniref:DNA helicase Pif1-like 2B domain-containing protein n=1 Tax=Arachis hypogaea TaxID=3818 RepID=A0A444X0C7_ARAHY|nr:hypothetical protein Ahy_B10g101668 isoform A [Arachis hypogaea]
MLLRNIDQFNGLCNGTRLQVRKLENYVIECEVLTRNNVDHITISTKTVFIIVSFTMTINKSQGQTLSHVRLYLPKPIFTHDQLYVTLSRVKSKRFKNFTYKSRKNICKFNH